MAVRIKANFDLDQKHGVAALFWHAATTPSGLSVKVMIGAAAILMLLFGIGFQFAAKTALGELFANGPVDHNAFVVNQLGALSDEPTKRPLLVLIGASVMRSSFGTTEEIETAFRHRAGQAVDILNLCTARQPILEHLALIDRLPRNRPVIVMLDTGPSSFTINREMLKELYDGDYLAVWSSEESDVAKQVGVNIGRHTGITLLDYPFFYLSRTSSFVKNLARLAIGHHPIRHDEEQYIGKKLPEERYRSNAIEIMKRFENADETIAFNRDLLTRTITFAKSRPNIRLALVEHPINPSFVSEYLGTERYSKHLAYMRDFAEKNDVPYWTIGLDLKLGPESFYDWAHISSDDAQKAMREVLVDRVVAEKWTD